MPTASCPRTHWLRVEAQTKTHTHSHSSIHHGASSTHRMGTHLPASCTLCSLWYTPRATRHLAGLRRRSPPSSQTLLSLWFCTSAHLHMCKRSRQMALQTHLRCVVGPTSPFLVYMRNSANWPPSFPPHPCQHTNSADKSSSHELRSTRPHMTTDLYNHFRPRIARHAAQVPVHATRQLLEEWAQSITLPPPIISHHTHTRPN